MNKDQIIPPDVSWQDITKGGTISCAGNARNFKTGAWKSISPKFISEKCTQCLLCVPMCPDNAIPLNDEGKRTDFDYSICKGCGICAKVCPFKAIEMEEEVN